MNQTSKRNLGILLIVLGAILVIYSIILGNTVINCPAGGCSSDVLWWASLPYLVSLLLGLALIIAGLILLIESKLAKADRQ